MRGFLCFLSVLTATCHLAAEGGAFVEAGGSYLRLSRADLPKRSSFALTALSQDRAAWAPFVGGGWRFSDFAAVRASYRLIDGVDAMASYSIADATGTYYVRNQYSDDLHMMSIAPEIRFRVTPSLALGVSPELHWVYVRRTTQTDSNAPMILVLPPHTASETDVTLGAAAEMAWTWSPGWATSLRYSWMDLDPSWNRRAHVLSGAVAWRW